MLPSLQHCEKVSKPINRQLPHLQVIIYIPSPSIVLGLITVSTLLGKNVLEQSGRLKKKKNNLQIFPANCSDIMASTVYQEVRAGILISGSTLQTPGEKVYILNLRLHSRLNESECPVQGLTDRHILNKSFLVILMCTHDWEPGN